ncbi:MAG: ribonuclease E [Parcubacteria group bacterium Gr01-1014_72]|nr:MAG: ribonuclease E [Parcubacteria group bacterium Gr01-1014_72]
MPQENTDGTDSAEKKDDILRPLRTYQADVEAALRSQKGSLAKIAIAESRRANELARQKVGAVRPQVAPQIPDESTAAKPARAESALEQEVRGELQGSEFQTESPPVGVGSAETRTSAPVGATAASPAPASGIRAIRRETPATPPVPIPSAGVSPEGGLVAPAEKVSPLDPETPVRVPPSTHTVRAPAEPARTSPPRGEVPLEALTVPPAPAARAGAGPVLFPEETAATASRARLLLIISLVLILGGGGAIGTLFLFRVKNESPPPQEGERGERSAIISAETSRELPAAGRKRTELIRLIRDERGKVTIAKGTIVLLTLTETTGDEALKERVTPGTPPTEPLSASAFAERMELKAPPSLLRSIENNFALGFYGGSVKETFIVFKTKSFETAFAGMLQWERNLGDDLVPLIGRSARGTTTSLRTTPFVDIVVRNKDARVLRLPAQAGSDTSTTTLIYALPDKETIVIAGSEEALAEINKRLLQRQLVR